MNCILDIHPLLLVRDSDTRIRWVLILSPCVACSAASLLPSFVWWCMWLSLTILFAVTPELTIPDHSRSCSQPEEHIFHGATVSVRAYSVASSAPAPPKHRWRSLGTNLRWCPYIPRRRPSHWSRRSRRQERSPTRRRSGRYKRKETSI